MHRIIEILRISWSRIETFFQYDISRTAAFEFAFAISIATLIYGENAQIFNVDVRSHALLLFTLWVLLSFRGFFIPWVTQSWVISVTGPKPPGVPLLLTFETKGGFIAGRKIYVRVNVIQLQKDRDSISEFASMYDEYNVMFPHSINLPIKDGRFLAGHPEAGGIKLTAAETKSETTIMFTSPGSYEPIYIFNKKGETKPYGGPMPDNIMKLHLVISPAEAWVSLRNYAITYALTLVILALTLVQLKLL